MTTYSRIRPQKKLILIVVFIFLTVFLRVRVVYTQEVGSEAFNRSFQEYRNRVEEYEAAHDEYELARSQYLKFNTLTAKANALAKTKSMLEQRDNVIIAYLDLQKTRLDENKGVETAKKEEIFTQVEGEKQWFADHKAKISSAESLDDLIDRSNETRDKYKLMEGFIYTTLFTLSDGRINDYQARLNDIFSETKQKMEIIKNEKRDEYKFSDRKIDIIERWIAEAESRAGKSEENQLKAQEWAERIVNLGTYNVAINFLEDARSYTKESTSYIKEIVREIKTAED